MATAQAPLPATAPKARITTGKGTPAEKSWNLRRPITLIGSRRTAHILLRHPEVSKAHCVVLNTGHHVIARDLNSRTGVLVNGQSIRSVEIRDGHVMKIGPVEIEFSIQSGTEHMDRDPLKMPCPLNLARKDSEERWLLSEAICVIGRKPGTDVFLDHTDVSLAHAIVCCVNDRLSLFDLGSRTGTWLNGQPIQFAYLKGGDTIRVGPFDMSVCLDGESPVANESAEATLGQEDLPSLVLQCGRALGSGDPTDISEALEDESVPMEPEAIEGHVPDVSKTITLSGSGNVAAGTTSSEGEGFEGTYSPENLISDLEQNLAVLQQNMAQSAQRLGQWQKRLEARSEQLDRRDAELNRKVEEIGQLEQELAHRKGEIDRYDQEIERREAELKAGQEELAKRQADLEGRLAQLANDAAGLDRAKAELEAARKSVEDSQNAVRARTAELDRTKAELEAARKALDESEDAAKARSAELDQRESEVKQREGRLTEREQELATQQQELQAAQDELEARRAEVAAEIAHQEEQLAESQAEVASKNEQLAERARQLDARHQELQVERERFDRERADWESKAKALENERREIAAAVSQLERDRAELASEKVAAKEEAQRRSAALEASSAEVEKRRQELQACSERQEAEAKALARMKEELEKVSGTWKSRADELDRREQELRQREAAVQQQAARVEKDLASVRKQTVLIQQLKAALAQANAVFATGSEPSDAPGGSSSSRSEPDVSGSVKTTASHGAETVGAVPEGNERADAAQTVGQAHGSPSETPHVEEPPAAPSPAPSTPQAVSSTHLDDAAQHANPAVSRRPDGGRKTDPSKPAGTSRTVAAPKDGPSKAELDPETLESLKMMRRLGAKGTDDELLAQLAAKHKSKGSEEGDGAKKKRWWSRT